MCVFGLGDETILTYRLPVTPYFSQHGPYRGQSHLDLICVEGETFSHSGGEGGHSPGQGFFYHMIQIQRRGSRGSLGT